MKIVSYNVNGIRASAKLGLVDWINEYNADVVCIQEVRAKEEVAKEVLYPSQQQLSLLLPTEECKLDQYYPIYNCGKVAGYAGTLIFSKVKPDKVFYDMGDFWQDEEGRTTTIVLGDLAIINAYIPNGNSRLDFKMQYLDALTKYIAFLRKEYKVVCVGDFNIAHNEIDLTNPKECKNKSVFLPIEREAFTRLLNIGMIDSYRFLYPSEIKYSWRSYKSRIDTNYNSWKYRIDYCLVSADLKECLYDADILDLPYSDHLAVFVELK